MVIDEGYYVTLSIEPTRNYPYLGLNRITDPQLPPSAYYLIS